RRPRQHDRRGFCGPFFFRDHLRIRPFSRSRMGVRHFPSLFFCSDVYPPPRAIWPPGVRQWVPWIGAAVLIALPVVYHDPYPLHILVLVLIWSFLYTSWSIMGRFGLVSLGHGGFMGIGAYVTALLWNHLHVVPWIGVPLAMLAAA